MIPNSATPRKWVSEAVRNAKAVVIAPVEIPGPTLRAVSRRASSPSEHDCRAWSYRVKKWIPKSIPSPTRIAPNDMLRMFKWPTARVVKPSDQVIARSRVIIASSGPRQPPMPANNTRITPTIPIRVDRTESRWLVSISSDSSTGIPVIPSFTSGCRIRTSSTICRKRRMAVRPRTKSALIGLDPQQHETHAPVVRDHVAAIGGRWPVAPTHRSRPTTVSGPCRVAAARRPGYPSSDWPPPESVAPAAAIECPRKTRARWPAARTAGADSPDGA